MYVCNLFRRECVCVLVYVRLCLEDTQDHILILRRVHTYFEHGVCVHVCTACVCYSVYFGNRCRVNRSGLEGATVIE